MDVRFALGLYHMYLASHAVCSSWMLKCGVFGSQMASKLLMTIPKNIRDFSQLMKALMEKEIGFACLFLNILR